MTNAERRMCTVPNKWHKAGDGVWQDSRFRLIQHPKNQNILIHWIHVCSICLMYMYVVFISMFYWRTHLNIFVTHLFCPLVDIYWQRPNSLCPNFEFPPNQRIGPAVRNQDVDQKLSSHITFYILSWYGCSTYQSVIQLIHPVETVGLKPLLFCVSVSSQWRQHQRSASWSRVLRDNPPRYVLKRTVYRFRFLWTRWPCY